MSASLKSVFPDPEGAISSAFFASTDVTEKAWHDVGVLATSDDVTLWTVLVNHPKVASVLEKLVMAVDAAHSSVSAAQRRQIKRENETDVATVVLRIAAGTGVCLQRRADPVQVAELTERVLPLRVLFPAALLLTRRSGLAACAAVSSLFLTNPGYLADVLAYMNRQNDSLDRLANSCVRELQRGRFQRLAGDILPLFEKTYRPVRQLWAVLQCAPWVADYVPLSTTLRSLRLVVDLISPILQHLMMTCEALNGHRDIFSRANSVIVNSATTAGTMLVLFHTYAVYQAGGKELKAPVPSEVTIYERRFCVPAIASATYDGVGDILARYSTGIPLLLSSGWKQGGNLQQLMHNLAPPPATSDIGGGSDLLLGHVIGALLRPMANCGDFTAALEASRHRYWELVLLDLVRQGLSLETLLTEHFVTPEEARQIGASETDVSNSLAGLGQPAGGAAGGAPTVAAATPAPTESTMEDVNDPMVSMVMDIFPNFRPAGIRAALNYYNNNVEQFVTDASIENLPPHLLSQLCPDVAAAAAAQEEEDRAMAAALAGEEQQEVSAFGEATTQNGTARHLIQSDFEDAVNMRYLLGHDFYDDGSDDDGSTGVDHFFSDMDDIALTRHTYDETASYADAAFNVDDDMRERIRMLTELMYDDEYDDGAGDEVPRNRPFNEEDDEGDNNNDGPAAGSPSGATAAEAAALPEAAAAAKPAGSSGPPQRDDYHDKRFHAKRAKEHSKVVQQKIAERNQAAAAAKDGTPSYAAKSKTTKKKANTKGGKQHRNRD